MGKTTKKNYHNMTVICKKLGLLPYKDFWGKIQKGVYSLDGMDAPIDLTVCSEDEKSILKTAVRQLSEIIDKSYQEQLESDLCE